MNLSGFQKMLLGILKPVLLLYLVKAAAKDVAADAECQAFLGALPAEQQAVCGAFVPLVVQAVAERIGVA